MREYILENYPTQLETFDTCVALGDLETEKYWCYFTTGKVANDLFAEEDSPFAAVFSKKQVGYKLADQHVPFPSEDELIALVPKLVVEGDDLKKSKWQLLAEAYINAQA